MKNNEEWFSHLETEESKVIETGNDTSQPIEHIREVPLSHVGQKVRLRNILHVPMITKNLVSINQIVDQGM